MRASDLVHAVDEFAFETRHAAHQRVDRHVGDRLDAVLGVAGLHHAGAGVSRLQLVAPDRVVDIHPERQLLLRNDLGDGARRRPEQVVAAVEVDRPGALAHRAERLHQSALRAPLRHPAEIGDQCPHLVHRRVDVDLCLQQRCCHGVLLGRIQLSPLCAPRDPRRTARRCHRKIDVPSAPTARPATVNGRHSCRPGTVNARTVAMSQPAVIATMTGQGSSRMAGSAGGSGATLHKRSRLRPTSEMDRCFRSFPETC